MITLSPIKRRILYVTLFEIFAILFSTWILMALSQGDAEDSFPVAVMVSVAAVVWNYLYNTVFESWERHKHLTVRTLRTRMLHAIGFEGGLLVICLPLYMLWYGVGIWKAFTMEITLLLFFLVYTFVFTLIFDRFFTLPHLQTAHEEETTRLS